MTISQMTADFQRETGRLRKELRSLALTVKVYGLGHAKGCPAAVCRSCTCGQYEAWLKIAPLLSKATVRR